MRRSRLVLWRRRDFWRLGLPVGFPTVLGDPEHHVPDRRGLRPGQLLTLGPSHDTDLETEGERTPPPPSPGACVPAGAAFSLHTLQAAEPSPPMHRGIVDDYFRPQLDQVRPRSPLIAPGNLRRLSFRRRRPARRVTASAERPTATPTGPMRGPSTDRTAAAVLPGVSRDPATGYRIWQERNGGPGVCPGSRNPQTPSPSSSRKNSSSAKSASSTANNPTSLLHLNGQVCRPVHHGHRIDGRALWQLSAVERVGVYRRLMPGR